MKHFKSLTQIYYSNINRTINNQFIVIKSRIYQNKTDVKSVFGMRNQ